MSAVGRIVTLAMNQGLLNELPPLERAHNGLACDVDE